MIKYNPNGSRNEAFGNMGKLDSLGGSFSAYIHTLRSLVLLGNTHIIVSGVVETPAGPLNDANKRFFISRRDAKTWRGAPARAH